MDYFWVFTISWSKVHPALFNGVRVHVHKSYAHLKLNSVSGYDFLIQFSRHIYLHYLGIKSNIWWIIFHNQWKFIALYVLSIQFSFKFDYIRCIKIFCLFFFKFTLNVNFIHIYTLQYKILIDSLVLSCHLFLYCI